MNNYLIPANSKSGQLILGLFRPIDIWILSIGIIISVFLLAFVSIDTLGRSNIWTSGISNTLLSQYFNGNNRII